MALQALSKVCTPFEERPPPAHSPRYLPLWGGGRGGEGDGLRGGGGGGGRAGGWQRRERVGNEGEEGVVAQCVLRRTPARTKTGHCISDCAACCGFPCFGFAISDRDVAIWDVAPGDERWREAVHALSPPPPPPPLWEADALDNPCTSGAQSGSKAKFSRERSSVTCRGRRALGWTRGACPPRRCSLCACPSLSSGLAGMPWDVRRRPVG